MLLTRNSQQRQVQERTENLGITGESMNRLEDNSSGFAEDMNKFISKQKKKAVMGKFGVMNTPDREIMTI